MENRYQTHLSHALSEGLDSLEIVAYHGTCLQALKRIIETGRQPSDNNDYRLGDIFVYPILGRAKLPFKREMYDEAEALVGARSYAKNKACDYYLAERLGIDLSTATKLPIIEGDITQLRNALQKMLGREYGWSETVKLFRETKKIKGIVIGYSQRIFDIGEPLPDPEIGMESSVRVINADIGSIIGLEPLDQESYDFLAAF